MPTHLPEKFDVSIASSLSEDEFTRFQKLTVSDVKLEYLTTRLLVRFALAKYLKTTMAEIEFAVDENGRPSLVAGDLVPPVFFSVSHSHGVVGCAFANIREVGLDLEWVSRDLNIEEVARTVFSREEIKNLDQCFGTDRQVLFFRKWTLKEAYLKALGLGLTDDLTKISFTHELETGVSALKTPQKSDKHPHLWNFRTFVPQRDHVGAIAYRSEAPPNLTYTHVSFENLIEPF